MFHTSLLDDTPRLVKSVMRPLLGVTAIAVVAYLLGVGFGSLDGFMGRWAILVIELGAALCCILRVVIVREERAAWTMLALAVSLWAVGDLVWRISYFAAENPPALTVPDAFWLAFYGFAYAGIALLMRDRARQADVAVWLDGLTAALAMAALASAVVLRAVLEQSGNPTLAIAVNFGYVLGDAVLIGMVLVGFALTGWRLDRAWAWLGVALAVFALSDSIYLYETASHSYSGGGLLDAGWALALLLVAIAAWHGGKPQPAPLREESWRAIALPIGFAAVALAIEVYDHFAHVTVLALLLATACLAVVFGRLAITFGRYMRMLRVSRQQATTDPLTGLPNRRQLMADLRQAQLDPSEERILLLLDLDRFKAYNDELGHSAGDELLARLGRDLDRAVAPWGRAYRMGGDEFCALLSPRGRNAGELVAISEAALRDEDTATPIASSAGWALIPTEARDASAALRLADRRMYAVKDGTRRPDRRAGPRSLAVD